MVTVRSTAGLVCTYPPLRIHGALDGDGSLHRRVGIVVSLRFYGDERVRVPDDLLNVGAASPDYRPHRRVRHTDLDLHKTKQS